MNGAWLLLLFSAGGAAPPGAPICIHATVSTAGITVQPAAPAVGLEVTSVAPAVELVVGPVETC